MLYYSCIQLFSVIYFYTTFPWTSVSSVASLLSFMLNEVIQVQLICSQYTTIRYHVKPFTSPAKQSLMPKRTDLTLLFSKWSITILRASVETVR